MESGGFSRRNICAYAETGRERRANKVKKKKRGSSTWRQLGASRLAHFVLLGNDG